MSALDHKSLASQQRRNALDPIAERLCGERPSSRLRDAFGRALVDLGEELCGRGRTINGHSAGDLTRVDVLDNITLYWLTNAAISAARLYWENEGMSIISAVNISIPAAVSVFPGEIYQAPRSWTERAYHKLIHYNKLDKGGHFAAWEQPLLFSEEVRAGFRPLRK